jgi:hypothetical protein
MNDEFDVALFTSLKPTFMADSGSKVSSDYSFKELKSRLIVQHKPGKAYVYIEGKPGEPVAEFEGPDANEQAFKFVQGHESGQNIIDSLRDSSKKQSNVRWYGEEYGYDKEFEEIQQLVPEIINRANNFLSGGPIDQEPYYEYQFLMDQASSAFNDLEDFTYERDKEQIAASYAKELNNLMNQLEEWERSTR